MLVQMNTVEKKATFRYLTFLPRSLGIWQTHQGAAGTVERCLFYPRILLDTEPVKDTERASEHFFHSVHF